MTRELLFRLTRHDFRWDAYRGSGKGGQKRNKTSNCCRCTHEASGAVGKSEEGRSFEQNRRRAFRRCVETQIFQKWLKVEVAKRTGAMVEVERWVDRELRSDRVKVEVKDAEGRWREESDAGENQEG